MTRGRLFRVDGDVWMAFVEEIYLTTNLGEMDVRECCLG